MYAHDVISDFERKKRMSRYSEEFKEDLEYFVSWIKAAHKIHTEKASTLAEVFEHLGGTYLFLDNVEECRLPYSVCWIDYETGNDPHPPDPKTGRFPPHVDKKGILVTSSTSGLILRAQIFLHVRNIWDSEGSVVTHWNSQPISWLISVGTTFGENPESEAAFEFYKIRDPMEKFLDGSKRINLLPLSSRAPEVLKGLSSGLQGSGRIEDTFKDHMEKDQHDLAHLQFFMLLLNCKNIVTEERFPSKKLNKKRSKIGKGPTFRYHVLRLTVPTSRTKKAKGQTTGSTQRIHFCRGHFKTYTMENPLFGNPECVGKYWWQAQVRGNKQKGAVMKEYDVKTTLRKGVSPE